MQLSITIDVDNADFEDDPHGAIISAVSPATYGAGKALAEGRTDMGSLKDSNGNRIGGWVLSEGAE